MKNKKNGKELAKVEQPDMTALEIPSYIKRGTKGLEAATEKDILIPRVKLLQAGSPEVNDLGLEPGHFCNSITKEDYGTEIVFVPIALYKTRIYFDEDNQIVCSSEDFENPRSEIEDCGPTCAECPRKDWNEKAKTQKEKQPDCDMFYNFPSLLAGRNEPMALSFSATKLRTAKELITRTKLADVPLFALVWRLRSKEVKDGKFTYWGLELEGAGFAKDATYKKCERLHDGLSGKVIRVDDTAVEKDL